MSERSTRQLRGMWALFLRGQQNDEPLMVGMNEVWLRTAGQRIWGDDSCIVELWASPSDRKYALAELAKTRPSVSPAPSRG